MTDSGLYPVPDDLSLGATIRGFVPGQRLFDRFVLQQVLGRGGMGVVWLAQDERLEQAVALKFLPEAVRLDSAALDDLKRETRRGLSLAHPHIVRIYDFIDDATAAAISMEFVDGPTLSALRIEQPTRIFEPAQIHEWMTQLVEALDYAHRRVKIVHRDLKPANLMINGAGELKVADFGIARSISDSVSRVTQRGGSSGTLVYMSPQQAQGKSPKVADDVYSLGATIYELLTSKPPFHSGNIQHQLDTITPPTMTERRAELEIAGEPIPEQWEQTVAACLAKEPGQRPQSIVEVGERLGLRASTATTPAFKTAPAPALEIPAPEPPPQPSGKGWLTGVGLAVVALALGGLGYYYGVVLPAQKAQQAQIAQQQADAQATEAAKEKAEADAALVSPQAKQTASDADTDVTTQRNIWPQILSSLNEKIPSGVWITSLKPAYVSAADPPGVQPHLIGSGAQAPDQINMLVLNGLYHANAQTVQVDPARLTDFIAGLATTPYFDIDPAKTSETLVSFTTPDTKPNSLAQNFSMHLKLKHAIKLRFDSSLSDTSNNSAPVGTSNPIAWKHSLDEEMSRLNLAAKVHAVSLPPNCYFGFDQYLSQLPPQDKITVLSQQATAIGHIADILINAPVNSITTIRRSDEDRGSPASGDQTVDFLKSASVQTIDGRYTNYPLEISFDCVTGTLRKVIDDLAQSPDGFVIRAINVDNSQPSSPQVGDLPQLAASSNSKNLYLFGNETLHVKLRIDAIDWTNGNPPLEFSTAPSFLWSDPASHNRLFISDTYLFYPSLYPNGKYIQTGGDSASSIPPQAVAPALVAAPAKTNAPNFPQGGQPWTNSLGIKFVPAGTDGILFSVWDVRVKDFQAFVDSTGYQASNGMYSATLSSTGFENWMASGGNWENPGFVQTATCPVVGVSWNDAHAFCDWLTKKEQAEGNLGPNQSYRLPTDTEWSTAVGLHENSDGSPQSKDNDDKIIGNTYPWGTTYPPPVEAGNYNRVGDANSLGTWSDIAGTDGYAYTSPVGSFSPNNYGLYDMGGNVWQWCEDWYSPNHKGRVLRGGSWLSYSPSRLLASNRRHNAPDGSQFDFGFRVVVATDSTTSTAATTPAAISGNTTQPTTVTPPTSEMASTPGTVYVMGQVKSQGSFDIPSDGKLTVSGVILQAGGLTDFADRQRVKLMRKKADGSTETIIVNLVEVLDHGQTDQDPIVKPGDAIVVPEKLIQF